MEVPVRSTKPRRKSDEVVTIAQMERWAFRIVLGVFIGGMLAAWKLSAQVSQLQQDVKEAQAIGGVVQDLTHEVVLLRKGQDSLITLMTDREKRDPTPRNPLSNR